jgi:hypothetical protein
LSIRSQLIPAGLFYAEKLSDISHASTSQPFTSDIKIKFEGKKRCIQH